MFKTRTFTVAMLLLFVLTGNIIAGAQEKTVVTMMASGGEIDNTFKEMFEAAHPDIEIEIMVNPGSSWTDVEPLMTMYSANISPDIMFVHSNSVAEVFSLGMAEDLTALFARDGYNLNDFLPGAKAYMVWEEQVMGLPLPGGNTIGSRFTQYNPRLFDEAGLMYPEADWTWDDMVHMAQKLTKDISGDGEPDVWGVAPPIHSAWHSFVWSAGIAEFVNPDFSSNLDDPRAIQALQNLVDLRGSVTPAPPGGGNPMFQASNAAIHLNPSLGGNISSWREQSRGGEPSFGFQAIPPPIMPGGTSAAVRGGSNIMVISSQTENLEAAWTVLKYSLSEEWELTRIQDDRYPAQLQYIHTPGFLSRDTPPYDFMPLVQADVKSFPLVKKWSEFDSAITSAISRAWKGESIAVVIEEILPAAEARLREANME